MLRHIMIVFAATAAALALAQVPAGAGAGHFELWSGIFGGTQANVTQSTLEKAEGQCVSVSQLTSSVLTDAQSAQNLTGVTVDLHSGADCTEANYLTTLSTSGQWSMPTNGQPTRYVYIP